MKKGEKQFSHPFLKNNNQKLIQEAVLFLLLCNRYKMIHMIFDWFQCLQISIN